MMVEAKINLSIPIFTEDFMHTISVEELENLDRSNITILDIRSEDDFRRGSLPGAIHVPMKRNLDEDRSEEGFFEPESVKAVENAIPANRPVYVFCHTGNQSQEAVKILTGLGYQAVNIEGGYRSWLRLSLERMVSNDSVTERTREIERTLIKKFRKSIWRPFTRAIRDYQLIQDGDRIAVCISGGKDSMLLAKLMQEIQKHGPVSFELVFLVMNPGYNADNWKIIQNNARILGIPLTVFETEIFDVVAEIDKNPCYLCARMRRGYLYSHAKELGCNKIALGHHFDDVIETILMGMLYGAKIETMMPKLHSQNFEGMELIRPLYLVKEADIKAWRDSNDLHFIQCACRFTENCTSCGGGRGSKRDEMKELIAQFRKISPFIESNIFNSVQNVNLRTIIGYHKDKEAYCFLDDYDDRKSREDS